MAIMKTEYKKLWAIAILKMSLVLVAFGSLWGFSMWLSWTFVLSDVDKSVGGWNSWANFLAVTLWIFLASLAGISLILGILYTCWVWLRWCFKSLVLRVIRDMHVNIALVEGGPDMYSNSAFTVGQRGLRDAVPAWAFAYYTRESQYDDFCLAWSAKTRQCVRGMKKS